MQSARRKLLRDFALRHSFGALSGRWSVMPTYQNRWKTQPRVRFGDPCYLCGIPMTPASREWCALTIPPGYRVHGSFGLCRKCYVSPAGKQLVAEIRDQQLGAK